MKIRVLYVGYGVTANIAASHAIAAARGSIPRTRIFSIHFFLHSRRVAPSVRLTVLPEIYMRSARKKEVSYINSP